MSCFIQSSFFLDINILVCFCIKKLGVGIKELKKYAKNALHFLTMNYCHVK